MTHLGKDGGTIRTVTELLDQPTLSLMLFMERLKDKMNPTLREAIIRELQKRGVDLLEAPTKVTSPQPDILEMVNEYLRL